MSFLRSLDLKAPSILSFHYIVAVKLNGAPMLSGLETFVFYVVALTRIGKKAKDS